MIQGKVGEGLSDLGQGTVKAATTLYTMDNNKKADELTGGFFSQAGQGARGNSEDLLGAGAKALSFWSNPSGTIMSKAAEILMPPPRSDYETPAQTYYQGQKKRP